METKGNFPNFCSDCQGDRADFVGGGGSRPAPCPAERGHCLRGRAPFSTGRADSSGPALPEPRGPARSLRPRLGRADQHSPSLAPAVLLPAGNGFIREWKRASRRAHFVSPSVCVDAAAVGVCDLCTYMALIITHKAL